LISVFALLFYVRHSDLCSLGCCPGKRIKTSKIMSTWPRISGVRKREIFENPYRLQISALECGQSLEFTL